MLREKKKVMVFGTFDGLHEGHRYFLSEARKLGDYFVVVVAHDEAVRELKGREPKEGMEDRAKNIRDAGLANEVVIGDTVKGSWNILEVHRPDIIAVGHDQVNLETELQKRFPNSKVVMLKELG